jgi:hypothetical protein
VKKGLEGLVCSLSKEVMDLRAAQAREIVALRAEFTQENRVMREELAKCDTSRQQENPGLREQQDDLGA